MINNIELYKNNIKKALNEKEYQRLKNQSVLITGANGMIGSAVVDVLNYLNESFNYNIKIYILNLKVCRFAGQVFHPSCLNSNNQ